MVSRRRVLPPQQRQPENNVSANPLLLFRGLIEILTQAAARWRWKVLDLLFTQGCHPCRRFPCSSNWAADVPGRFVMRGDARNLCELMRVI